MRTRFDTNIIQIATKSSTEQRETTTTAADPKSFPVVGLGRPVPGICCGILTGIALGHLKQALGNLPQMKHIMSRP